MKKIPLIFKRNPDNMNEILTEPNPLCLWVFEGEGVATRKYDGTCCKIENGLYFKRREIKKNKKAPIDFIEEEEDKITGKRVGWVPVTDTPNDKYHIEAFHPNLSNGTYELLGPKVQGNPEKVTRHLLMKHSKATHYPYMPRDFVNMKKWFIDMDIEGVVFHHPDGRMAKIRKKDFGLERRVIQWIE